VPPVSSSEVIPPVPPVSSSAVVPPVSSSETTVISSSAVVLPSSSEVVPPSSESSSEVVPPSSNSSHSVVPEPNTSDYTSEEYMDLNKTMVNTFTYSNVESDGFHNHTVVVYDDYDADNVTDSEVIDRYNVS